MPHMTGPVGQQRIVPDHSVGLYERRGWTERATTTQSPPDRPADTDLKADWVDHAVAQGANRSDAESMTKAELVETYG